MAKSQEAFRTIGEVSEELDVPKHVLRFWEARFPQLKPMKRGGGRRFYRPEDVALLRGIHHLLHVAGYTIRGVQKIMRDSGADAVKHATQRPLPEAAGGGRKVTLAKVMSELEACLDLLRGDGAGAAATKTAPTRRKRA